MAGEKLNIKKDIKTGSGGSVVVLASVFLYLAT